MAQTGKRADDDESPDGKQLPLPWAQNTRGVPSTLPVGELVIGKGKSNRASFMLY